MDGTNEFPKGINVHLSDRLLSSAEMEKCLGDADSDLVFRDLASHAAFDEQRIATLLRVRLNCHELMLDCWNQFAQLPDGYSTQDLSTLEDLKSALFSLGLIDDDGNPQWETLEEARAVTDTARKDG